MSNKPEDVVIDTNRLALLLHFNDAMQNVERDLLIEDLYSYTRSEHDDDHTSIIRDIRAIVKDEDRYLKLLEDFSLSPQEFVLVIHRIFPTCFTKAIKDTLIKYNKKNVRRKKRRARA